jgi:putative glutamine amidotransferase
MRVTEAEGYSEPRDSISHDWLNILSAWGMSPLLVPNIGTDADDFISVYAPQLLVLTGGEDIGTSSLRDENEVRLLNVAIERRLPVFGVCRGLQFINTHFGGSLGRVENHVAMPHFVEVTSSWQKFYGAEVKVNSYHNTSIMPDGLAQPLTATAHDLDGNIEAAVHKDLPIAAVMWHPERSGSAEGDIKLIRSIL